MRAIDRPRLTAKAAMDACISSIQDLGMKGNLAAALPTIIAAEAEYLAHGDNMTLFSILQTPSVGAFLSREDMKRVYAGTFVKSVRTRAMYDAIKTAPANDMCPLCSQRTVSTLDHYLAQSLHSALAVVPANLVPACSECNKAKLDRQPVDEADQTLHPYFDSCDDDSWLSATVVEAAPAALHFRVVAPAGWTAVKLRRVMRHFDVFGLGPLYASHAAVEITNIRYLLGRIGKRGGSESIRAFLADQAMSSSAVHRNSWRTATYVALSQSAWFCGGGYANI